MEEDWTITDDYLAAAEEGDAEAVLDCLNKGADIHGDNDWAYRETWTKHPSVFTALVARELPRDLKWFTQDVADWREDPEGIELYPECVEALMNKIQ